MSFFKALKITGEKERQISLLFNACDRDKDDRLDMNEFNDMISPYQKEYRV